MSGFSSQSEQTNHLQRDVKDDDDYNDNEKSNGVEGFSSKIVVSREKKNVAQSIIDNKYSLSRTQQDNLFK